MHVGKRKNHQIGITIVVDILCVVAEHGIFLGLELIF